MPKKKKGKAMAKDAKSPQHDAAAAPSTNSDALDLRTAFEDLLHDPNSTRARRDMALSHLNDSIGMGTMFTGEAEIKLGDDQFEWTIIEDFEEGNWDGGETAIVSAAADIILEKEGDDSMEIS